MNRKGFQIQKLKKGRWSIRIPLARLIEIQKSKSRGVDYENVSSLKTKNEEEGNGKVQSRD